MATRMKHLQRPCVLLTLLTCAGLVGCASLPLQPGISLRSRDSQTNAVSSAALHGAEQSIRQDQPTDAAHKLPEDTSKPSGKDDGISSQPVAAEKRDDPAQNTRQSPSGVPSPEANRPNAVSINLLVEELEAEGILTPQSKAQLVEDLCRTPPDLWPAVVDFFRASVELRRKRGSSTASPVEGLPANSSLTPPGQSALPSLAEQAQGSDSRSAFPDVQSAALHGNDRVNGRAEDRASAIRPATITQQPGQPATVLTRAELSDSLDQVSPGTPTSLQPVGEATVSDVSIRGASPITTATTPSNGSWQEYLRQAVKSLNETSRRDDADEIRLRLLELALANRENALQPIPGMSPALQEFWSETLFALGLLQDSHLNPDPKLRLAEARRHLQNGIRRLGEECPLEVTGLAFVTAVQSWGVYEAFDKYEFVPGQKVLLYAEVENLSAESTPKGFRTAWRSSYQILDGTGKEVARYEYAPNEEYCRRPRRDFFIGCELSFPRDAAAGRYVLRLTVVDLITNRVGQGTIEFTLRTQAAK